jgi:hypothetical protein
MTLATVSRAPLAIPRSPARERVAAAATELQRAVDDLYAEARKQAAERARRDEEMDRKAQARLHLAAARLATKELRVEVPTKFFWDFCAEGLDALRELAAEARQRGQQMRAQGIDARVDGICAELERIQKRAAG